MTDRTCSIDGCDKPVLARGWCTNHYSRWHRNGDPLISMKTRGSCSVDGCDRLHVARGFCGTHWLRHYEALFPAARGRRLARSRWGQMIRRCTDPADAEWHNYGGRGVVVATEWLTFDTYYRDTGDKPAPGMSLDRIDNDGPYSNANIRWATLFQQVHNRRPTRTGTKTHCPQGHPYDETNTYVKPNGSQMCRTCGREAMRRRRSRQREVPAS